MPFNRRSGRFKRTTTKRRYKRPRRKFNTRRRVAQGVTRNIVYFKSALAITASPGGIITFNQSPDEVVTARDWTQQAQNWEEFKVLNIKTYFIPSQVGSESLALAPLAGGPPRPTHVRGDAVSWIDFNSPGGTPTSVLNVINVPSARIFNPRRFHKRWTQRPRSYPNWGATNAAGGIIVTDQWKGTINLFGEGFTPSGAVGTQQYWYAQRMWKVIFRGRRAR